MTAHPKTQQARVVVQLRELILRGALAPGERVTEATVAERLGVSRTPIRQALPLLAQEGLLSPAGKRGYVVRSFGVQDVLDAIDVRGVLEALAGRLVAERGPSRGLMRQLEDCLREGDTLFEKGKFSNGDESRYADMNGRFHALIVDAAGSKTISDVIAHNDRVPFAAAGAGACDKATAAAMYTMLQYAHRQHHAIVQALANGEGTRVEALLREHTYPVKESLNLLNPGSVENGAVSAENRLAVARV